MDQHGKKTIKLKPSFFLLTSLMLTGAALLSGCNADAKNNADKTSIVAGPACKINDLSQGWATCKEGQVLAFLPTSWGNEQLPILATALYCDFHHPIVQNNGGVVCVFTGKRKPVEAPADKQPKAAE